MTSQRLRPGWAVAPTTTDQSEFAWHRNRRSRRQRARHTIVLWKAGCTVSPSRLSIAKDALADHHGTRGSDPMANGKGNGKIIAVGGGYSYTGRNVKPDEWWCPDAEYQKCCPDPRGYYVFANRDTCNRCSAKKPKNPYLFRQSSCFKGTPTAGGGGGQGGNVGRGQGQGQRKRSSRRRWSYQSRRRRPFGQRIARTARANEKGK